MERLGLTVLVDRLLALSPGCPEAKQQQHAIEHLLMDTLRFEGCGAAEALVESLVTHGHGLERLAALPYMWRVLIPPPRVLELWFTGAEAMAVVGLSYREGAPWGTRAQKRAAKLQAAFYARYEGLGPGEDPRATALAPDDRLIVLVGELEADVNNGGFGQYLGNKGVERAREALAALGAIGAKRTARWLSLALDAGKDSADLERMDEQFCAKPEDLASLAMRYLERRGRA
ncbi:MAG: DUF4375 domain-containing protein [Betaproteobacteria bacterium]|nr:DUF4375 domain-containing protein [Betaproteobacteria bacterium]